MDKAINALQCQRPSDAKSFASLLSKAEANQVRDSFLLIDWGDSRGGRIQAGFAVVYPGCRTGGHHHDDAEEVYHVVGGSGIMHIGESAFEVREGDTWLVPLHEPHWTDNPGNLPLQMFWIVVKL